MELYKSQRTPPPQDAPCALEVLVPQLTFGELCEIMIRAYGATVAFSEAGRIAGKNAATIKRMAEDGRITAVCEGARIDTTSLVRYMCAPKTLDFEARATRHMEKTGSRFYV
ncbi:MAG: hypothetical protein RR337_12725 [Clostridia bacterium]